MYKSLPLVYKGSCYLRDLKYPPPFSPNTLEINTLYQWQYLIQLQLRLILKFRVILKKKKKEEDYMNS